MSDASAVMTQAFGAPVSSETWLTVEVCVLANSPDATQLREVVEEMHRRGLPVYVSISKRGTPFQAGTCQTR